jgi:hypothetical protein
VTFAVEADPGEARLWAIELRHVFGRAIRLHHERGQVTAETFARRRLLIENATDRLVFDRYVAPTTEAARLQERYQLHRDSLHVFLDRDDVEPTNNSSERDLRPPVIHRKVIGPSGWGGVFLWDHIRWREPVRAAADPWIALTAMACATSRIRIGLW